MAHDPRELHTGGAESGASPHPPGPTRGLPARSSPFSGPETGSAATRSSGGDTRRESGIGHSSATSATRLQGAPQGDVGGHRRAGRELVGFPPQDSPRTPKTGRDVQNRGPNKPIHGPGKPAHDLQHPQTVTTAQESQPGPSQPLQAGGHRPRFPTSGGSGPADPGTNPAGCIRDDYPYQFVDIAESGEVVCGQVPRLVGAGPSSRTPVPEAIYGPGGACSNDSWSLSAATNWASGSRQRRWSARSWARTGGRLDRR